LYTQKYIFIHFVPTAQGVGSDDSGTSALFCGIRSLHTQLLPACLTSVPDLSHEYIRLIMQTTPSIPRRCFCGLLIALFAALLFLPLFQQITGIPKDQNLIGFRNRTGDAPAWTLKRWQDGAFAMETHTWLREHAGLRGTLVKVNRQLRYSLFAKMAPAPLHNHALVIGRGNMLHENLYLQEAIHPPRMTPEKIDAFGERLARLQGLLREQGMAFLVIAAPSKARLYPDTLPAWARDHIQKDGHDYQTFIHALEKYQIPHLDTMELFARLRSERPGLMAPHSAHWSFYGAWIAWLHAIPLINQQELLPEIPVPETVEVVWEPAMDMDAEMRAQLNLFFGSHTNAIPAAYPVAADLPPGTEPQVKALIVGDSYGFGLMDALSRSRVCKTVQYWFYMKSFYECPEGSYESRDHRILSCNEKRGHFRSNDENGLRFMADKNVVILIMTGFNIDKMTWGFDRMINRLYGDPNDNLPLTAGVPLSHEN